MPTQDWSDAQRKRPDEQERTRWRRAIRGIRLANEAAARGEPPPFWPLKRDDPPEGP